MTGEIASVRLSTRLFEDVSEREQLPPLRIEPDTRQLVMYAGASGDFQPIHYDRDVAQAAGHDAVIVHGALKSAWLAKLVTDWIGHTGRLREFSVQYRGIDYAGRKTCRGVVKSKRTDGESGQVEIDLSLEDEAGNVTTRGRALVELPRRDAG